jgi:hypothetical protein
MNCKHDKLKYHECCNKVICEDCKKSWDNIATSIYYHIPYNPYNPLTPPYYITSRTVSYGTANEIGATTPQNNSV